MQQSSGAVRGYPAQGHWSVDRRIPVALIVTLFIQGSAGVWAAAQLFSQVSANSAAIVKYGERIATIESRQGAVDATLARVDRAPDRAVGGPLGDQGVAA